MPTSATGNDQRSTAGFTLVELMVVLVITGLMGALVVLAMPDPRRAVADDARALGARLVAARDLSIIGGRDVGVRFDGGGYGFVQRRRDGWQALAAKALQPRRWSDGITARPQIDGGDLLLFDATGLATPATIILQRGEVRARVQVDVAGAVRVDAR